MGIRALSLFIGRLSYVCLALLSGGRRRAITSRAALLAGLVVLLVAPVLLAPPVAGAAQSQVYVESVRDVCHFPRPDNNAKVVGQDWGYSAKLGSTTYFIFGDTFSDTNGDGGLSPTDEMTAIGNSIAKTTDEVAGDCIDNLTYKTDSRGFAAPLLPRVEPDECGAWPGGIVAANGQIYFFYLSVERDHCIVFENFRAYGTGLAKITNRDTMEATRIGTGPRPLFWDWGEPSFAHPFTVSGGWVYILGTRTPIDPLSPVYVARVRENEIEQEGQYEYWNVSSRSWVDQVPQGGAAGIFEDHSYGIGNIPTIAYNSALDRYLALYSCGVQRSLPLKTSATMICARTAQQSGSSPTAITGGWNDPKVIYDCPNEFTHIVPTHPRGPWLDCYGDLQHPQYGSGGTIYVTSSRNTAGSKLPGTAVNRYWNMLKEFRLSAQPPVDGPRFINAASDYSDSQGTIPTSARAYPPDMHNWLYQAQSDSTYENLAWYPEYLGALDFNAWACRVPPTGPVCPDSAGPGPMIGEDAALPGKYTDAVRTWVTPHLFDKKPSEARDLRISGEVWKQRSCGDKLKARIVRVRRRGESTVLWYSELPHAGTPARSALYDLNTSVRSGDRIEFRVERYGVDANCDDAYFNPTMVFRSLDSDSDGWSDGAEDYIGTDPNDGCGGPAWPPDINNDGHVDLMNDLFGVAFQFGRVSPRHDMNADGMVDLMNDIFTIAWVFGHDCD